MLVNQCFWFIVYNVKFSLRAVNVLLLLLLHTIFNSKSQDLRSQLTKIVLFCFQKVLSMYFLNIIFSLQKTSKPRFQDRGEGSPT